MRLRTLLLLSTALAPLAVAPAHAGPDGANVVGGKATVQGQGTANVTVNQSSQNAIINWRLFDIGVGEKTTFSQPNSNAIALNRVTGGMGPSQILGTLQANGKVFVINRDGILFGAGAVINTAGFLATTSDIRNEDFMAGRFNFNIPGRPDASIVNLGMITATSGGFAALVAPGVRNSGTITANLGSVTLAAGNSFNLDFYGDKLITLGLSDQIAGQVQDVATGQTLRALVTNDGKLKANGGRVELTAAAARQVVDSVINTSGVVEANSVGTRNGQIVLSAATAGSKGAGLPKQTVKIAGTLSAAGKRKDTKGGKITVTGENIELAGATVNASGRAGGGSVMIGGDWGGGNPDKSLTNNQSAALDPNVIPNATTLSVDRATTIDASARDSGNGGKVILWSDVKTTFAGTILALGGKTFGNGGFVETSSHGVLDFTGLVSTKAPNGRDGTLLLDPADYYIEQSFVTPPFGASHITVSDLQTQLSNGNVIIATDNNSNPALQNGDIFIRNGVNLSWTGNNSLTLSAFRNVDVADNVNITHSAGTGGLNVRADSTGTGIGNIIFNQATNGIRFNFTASAGKVNFYYNPVSYTSPTDFTPTGQGGGTRGVTTSFPDQFTAYMLVNTPANLQAIGTNATTLAGNYALGPADLDMTGFPFLPIGEVGNPFMGRFDGLGNTISNLTIAPTSGLNSIGLFGAIGATGLVRNLTITNASVTADPNTGGLGQFIGIVAGSNIGTISNLTVDGTVSNGTVQNGVGAGGLVGQNGIFGPGAGLGTIMTSTADVTVTVGNSTTGSQNNNAGGLVGNNPGIIITSFATGNVSGGSNSFIGGLVGRNETTATITGSGAGGDVSISDATGSGAGGFVGFNFGTISGTNVAVGNVTGGASSDIFHSGSFGGFVGLNDAAGQISGGVAGGNVSAGANSVAGGFVGFNNGTITGSGAAGSVTSQDFVGGFAAFNGSGGTISSSTAIGDVSSAGQSAGGFVGDNAGTIIASSAIGNVTATSLSGENDAGGFAGNNSGAISASFAFGNVTSVNSAGGFVGSNGGSIDSSGASGTVTVGDNATAGGFVSGNFGLITNSSASGNVTGGADTVLGGFAAGNFGLIDNSGAFGSVISTGARSVLGGFAGLNINTIANSYSSGAVSATSESYLGGLVGINAGLIQDSPSDSSVTGSGAHNIAGGLVGANIGLIDPSNATGNVSSGPDSILGSLVGINGALRLPDGSTFVGTTADSSGTGTVNGSAGPQVGQDYPVAGLPVLPGAPCQGNSGFLCGGTLFNPNGQDLGRDPFNDRPVISPLLNIAATLVNQVLTEKKQEDVVEVKDNSTPGTSGGSNAGSSKGGGGGAGNAGRPPANVVPAIGLGPLPSGMPPIGETRFASNEVVMQLGLVLTPERVAELARQYGLEIISSQTFGLLGRTVYRFRIAGGLPVRDAIAGLQSNGPTISAQPSYTFLLDQGSAEPAAASSAPADSNRKGDSAQYIVTKLGLVEAHGIATGKGVKIAVIDSEIDSQHPDLQGVIAGNYDALPSDDQRPHPHGTGMAGAIGSHQRLLGVAPGARILAVRAFGVSDSGAQGTSMNIVKGLEWAVKEGAQVINMSFAGPRDPILEQALKTLKDRGIILIGAAGNAGPKSPPLFPGADPNVIGVSATDVDDKTYKNAVRGKQVAIAAPGVDILVPAPEGGYQLTTGTSVAAAHISGVVALMLERNPKLSPNDVRSILAASAKKLPQGRNDAGAGLVDPVQALSKSGPKQAAVR